MPEPLDCDWKLQESFMRIPLLSPIDSASSHYCQSGQHCLPGRSCAAGDCQGSRVRRAARRTPAVPAARDHQGPLPPARGCLGRMPQLKLRPFALQHIMHTAGNHRGVKPLVREWRSVSTKAAAEALAATGFTGLSTGKHYCPLSRDCLVRKMT